MTSGKSSRGISLLFLVAAALVLSFVWRIQELFPILAALQLPKVTLLGGLALMVVGGHFARLPADVRHPSLRWMIVILALVTASVPFSLYPGLSFGFLTADFLTTMVMVVLVLGAVGSFRDAEFMTGVLAIGAAIYCWFIVTRFTVGMGGRLGGLVYYDANDLALWIVVTLPIAVYFLTKPGAKLWVRLLIGGIAALMMLALVKTGSRGGFLGLIAVGAYLLIGYRSIPVQRRVAAAGGLVLLLLVIAGDQYWELMATLLNPTEDYNWQAQPGGGGGGRRAVWGRGLGYMLENPLFGVGARAFPVAEGTLGPTAHLQALGRGLKWSAAHSSFVQVGAELGVLGLVAFVGMLVTGYRSAQRVAKKVGGDPRAKALGQALGGSIIGFAVSGAFLSQAYGAYLYALLALIIALERVAPSEGGILMEPASPGPRWRRNVVAPTRSVREPVHVRRTRRGGGPAEAGG